MLGRPTWLADCLPASLAALAVQVAKQLSWPRLLGMALDAARGESCMQGRRLQSFRLLARAAVQRWWHWLLGCACSAPCSNAVRVPVAALSILQACCTCTAGRYTTVT